MPPSAFPQNILTTPFSLFRQDVSCLTYFSGASLILKIVFQKTDPYLYLPCSTSSSFKITLHLTKPQKWLVFHFSCKLNTLWGNHFGFILLVRPQKASLLYNCYRLCQCFWFDLKRKIVAYLFYCFRRNRLSLSMIRSDTSALRSDHRIIMF